MALQCAVANGDGPAAGLLPRKMCAWANIPLTDSCEIGQMVSASMGGSPTRTGLG